MKSYSIQVGRGFRLEKDGLLFVEEDPYFALDDSFAHFTPRSAMSVSDREADENSLFTGIMLTITY